MGRRRTKHYNLWLDAGEQSMLRDLSGCMGLRQTEVLRQLVWATHQRMGAHLAEHQLPPSTQLRLTGSGDFIHQPVLHVDRARIIRNIEGALLIDRAASIWLHQLAGLTGRKAQDLVQDLVYMAARTAHITTGVNTNGGGCPSD